MTVERSVVAGTLRAIRFAPVALSAALGVIPLVLFRSDRSVDVAVLGAAVVSALGIGYTLDDPAAATLDPVPVTLRSRSAIRIGAAIGIVAAVFAFQLFVSGLVHPGEPVPRWGWFAIAAALATSTLAVAALARARTPAHTGTVAAWTAPTLVALCFVQWQVVAALGARPLLTVVASDPAVDRWWWVTALATIVLAHQTRDPAAPGWRAGVMPTARAR